MMGKSSELPVIGCTLEPTELQVRLAWIAQLNAAALRNFRREDLRLELIYWPAAIEKVREMVQREQRCCAFLSFAIRQEQSVVKVLIQVPEGKREIAETVFESFLAKAPGKVEGTLNDRSDSGGKSE